jgi:hypothetical protein
MAVTGERRAAAGVCANGHNLRAEGAITKDNKCCECRRDRQRRLARRRGVPLRSPNTYANVTLPPLVVRMNAACGLETAHLYEKRQAREKPASVAARHQLAATICARCPVFAECKEWHRNSRATETIAAVQMDPRWSE